MSVEPEVPPVEGDSSAVYTPDTLRVKMKLLAAMGVLAVGLDLSRLLEQLRVNDAVYLTIHENKRRFLVVVDFVKSLRGNHDLVASEEPEKSRGGPLGRLFNNRTYLTTDDEYIQKV